MRKKPTMEEKLASALLQGKAIDHDAAKAMSAKQINALFDFDHVVYHAIGGTNHPSNLVPRLRAEHRAKTAKIDIPAIAKGKRLEKDQHAFREKILAKAGQETVSEAGPEDNAARKQKKWKYTVVSGPKLRSQPMPFGRKSAKRKKLSGKIEDRKGHNNA